ncbi:cobalamin B12-binding domain-containing protein [Chitinimonas sp. PSY-7]|uniref:cobalamin-dependent protein n=1 Tax=Chitinimonas sp. PSY-7 TaxID=3459088 RepID=UPI004040354D
MSDFLPGKPSHMAGKHADRFSSTLTDSIGIDGLHESTANLQDVMRYMEATLSGNQRVAQELVNGAMRAGCTLSETAVGIVQPAMYEVGRLWQEGRITVAQEHLATAISQNVLTRAYLQAAFAPPVWRKAIFACSVGNQHSLGLTVLSDAFETIGWEVSYLGADVPICDLIKQIDTEKPDLMCMSLSMPSHLSIARETVERMRVELGNQCPTIWVGGLATTVAERVWHDVVKADGWAMDALQAIRQIGP